MKNAFLEMLGFVSLASAFIQNVELHETATSFLIPLGLAIGIFGFF